MRTNLVQTCKTSAHRINLNRITIRVALIGLFISLGIGNAWGSTTYYSKVTTSQSPTGKGTVYVVAGGTFSGTATSATNNGTSQAQTYSLQATPTVAGYYFVNWKSTGTATVSFNNANSASTTATISASSTTSGSPTTGNAQANWAEITINNGTASPATIAAEDNSATATTNTCTVTYATKGDNANDVKAPTISSSTGHGAFTAALGSVTSAGAATVNVTFKGDGTYGGNVAAGSRSRTSSAVVTLTSAVGNNKGTCTVTASFPNIIIGDGSFDHMSTINTVPKSATATFPVQWADDVEDFSASFGSVTGGGAWTVDDVTYTATDARSGTISIDYTFNPNGAEGDHSAVLTLAANANAGGASKTLTLTAEAEALAAYDASIGDTKYTTLAAAITAANGMNTNPTVKILRNVEGLTSALEIKKPMTIDLNSFTVSGTLTSSVNKLFYLNTATAVLTINDSRNGGKISATGNAAAALTAVLVDKGSLVLTKGDIEIENTNTGASAAAKAVKIAAGARFGQTAGNLVATTAGTGAYGLEVTTNPADVNMVGVTGGTITATAAATAVGVNCLSSSATASGDPTAANVALDGVTVNATSTATDAYAVQSAAGVILGINSGTYNATAATTKARALLTKGYTAVVNGTFNATSGATDANAIRVEAGIAAVRNGAFFATTVQRIAHAGYVAANAKLLTYGGTFHGKSTAIIANGWATGTQVVSGGTLEAQGGTFIGEVANDGLTAAQTSYAAGIYANTGSNVTLANATLRGLTDNTYVNGAYALYTSTVNPVSLTNCTLEATSTDQYAYGVRLEGGATPLTMNNCTVNATAATLYAYGFYQNNATSTIDVTGSTFNVTSNGTRAYGIYVNAGTSFSATDCDFTVRTLQSTAGAAAGSYLRGIFVAAGKQANLTGCTFNVSGHATYSTDAYGLYISGSVNVENTDVTVSSVKSGYAIFNDGSTTAINIFSGKFSATTAESNATAAAAKQQLYGGFYVHNNNLAKYLPEGYMVETLTAGTEFNAGYKYHVRPETVVNDPVCKIGSIGYATLEEALDFVNKNSGTANTIYMVKNYTLPAGNYTLPAKATLLVPYKDGQTTAIGTTPSRADSYATRSPYRTLTFASGAKMTVYGTIEASAQQNRTDQTSSGEVRGPFGYIILNENASITLEKNAILIAWGFVCGKGTITVKDGAKAYEMLSLGWYKGGNTTLKLYNNESYKVFVMTDYAYQNIECAITYHPGAQALAAASTDYFSPNDVELVGTSTTSFFKMVKEEASADTWVRKEYDPKTDYTTWTMNNGASMSAIKLDSYSSENFYLPITSNFRIVLNYGEMTLGGDIEFHAGAELIIKKEATGKIASGKTVVFYDGDDWRTGLGSSGKYYYPVTYSPSWKAATGATTNPRLAKYKQLSTSTAPNYLPDAALFVQGKLEVSGNLYTTGDGNKVTAYRNSNIYSSNDDAGKIIYKTTAPASSTTKTMYKCTAMYGMSSGKGIKDMLANGNSTAYPALLQNGDGTYETTGGTAANSSWIYKNDHWVMVTTEGCFSVEQISGVKHYYAYPAGFVEVSSNIEDANHLYTDAATGNRRFLVDNDCVWWEVEPTPYDGNKYKCVTPDHNGKYKYYEYVGGWQEATVTVTWSINGTNTNYTVLYGTHPKYLSASPSKASTTTDYYTWLGWTKGSTEGEFFAKDAELPVATENTTYYAYFKADKFTFRATFNNYDGSLIETKLVAVGETPVYEGETPVKPATTSKEYTFTGWSPALAAISNAPVTYTAQFSETTRKYTITWTNYDGTILKTEKVAYGTTPSAPTVTPTRPNDNYYTYTFDAWSPAIASVGGDQTYTATYNYEKKVPKYTATFKNGSETVYAPSLKSGEVPVFDGTIPTKTADAQYTYTFDGWSTTDGGALVYATGAPLPALTADVTYYAHFAAATNNYRIIWKSENGKVTLETDPTVPYGTTPSFDGAKPTKDRMGATVYTFDGWSATIGGSKIALPFVASNATYYAHFSDLPVYTVTFDANGHGTAPSSQEVVKNQHVIEPAALSAAEWIFGGWYKEAECINAWDFASDVVTGTTTLFAKWTAAVASVTAGGETTYYATLATAITAANGKTNPTVKMLKDVTFSAAGPNITTTMTLDLNGKTIQSTRTVHGSFVLKVNNAGITVTITDSSTGGKIDHTATIAANTDGNSYAYGIHVANGTLNVAGGTICAKNTSTTIDDKYRAYGIYCPAAGSVTMSDGRVEAWRPETSQAFGIYAQGDLTMTGGTVYANADTKARGIYVYGASTSTAIATLANVTVEAETSGDNCLAIYGYAYADITVNSGTYTANGTGGTVYAVYARNQATVSGSINGGKFSAPAKELFKGTNATFTLSGGYYVHETDLEANCATNYHVLPLEGEEPYMYEVAEAYTLTWNLDGGTVITAGTQAPVDATGSPSGYVAKGATLTAPVVEKTGYTFDGWNTSGGTAAATMPAANTTYMATWVAAIADRELDIVDWTSNSITINVTNLKAVGGTNKNNWKIYVNNKDYTRTSSECSTQSRTLTISGLSLTPNDNLLIQLKNDEGVIESQHNYKIPQIYNAENATLSGTDTDTESVVYVYGGKLTISGDAALAALYVCPGAEVEIKGSLTVGKLVLRTKPWATAAISGNVSATNVYYTRIAPDGSDSYPTGKYYQFGLPYECAISAVRLSDGTTPAYNTTWILKSYDEESRATNGATGENWDVLASTGKIAAGRGYEMFSTYKYYREYYFPVTPTENTSVDVTRHGEDKNNSGWNIVCSPLMNVYENPSDPVDGLKVSWLRTDGYYDQEWPETIWPAMPFSYQASATGSLDFSTNEFNQTVSAPRRAAYKENIQTEWLHLDVKDGNGVGDHTSVFVHPERFEDTYETGIDVAKQSLTASRALVYSTHAYGDMAFAGVSDNKLTNGIPLVVYSPKEQELTISMRENNWLNRLTAVWLIDHETGIRTDLLWSTYTFDAAEGTAKGRFTLMGEFKAPQVTTGLENGQSDQEPSTKARKVIIEDKIYIQLNGRMYDSTGKKVN